MIAYSAIFDGPFWKAHPLYGEAVILIRLYGDDFEPASPLGSHKTLYKIGTIYYQFENLPVTMQANWKTYFWFCVITQMKLSHLAGKKF